MNVMRRVGTQLLEERKAAALWVFTQMLCWQVLISSISRAEAAQGEKISTSRARDLLSLLVRANTTADPRERLSDEDVLARTWRELASTRLLKDMIRDTNIPCRRP
jgi:hypothetical protein